ncbi:hypothetical protein Avbf_11012 [Armadillidium vulgare]|nr:hypothetical protein Avbf_11012 [Armadillidium vulgare]
MLLIFNKRKSLDENASVPSPAEPLKCSECSFETENPKCFRSFIHKFILEIQKCPECWVMKALIQRHSKITSDKTHLDESDSDFEDEMSNEEMDTRDNNYHRRKKKLRCHDCSYTTWRSEFNFVAHCLDHTKEKLFKCEFCDFKTNYRRTIKKHNLKCIKESRKQPW